MVLEAHVVLCVTELYVLKKNIFAPEMGKMGQKWLRNRVFFEFIGKSSH